MFGLLLFEDQLITLVRPKRYSLHPAGILRDIDYEGHKEARDGGGRCKMKEGKKE